MAILPLETMYDTNVRLTDDWLDEIDLSSGKARGIIAEFGRNSDNIASLLALLKSINPNILAITDDGWFYDVMYRGRRQHLPIMCLSTGERLVAICHMAEVTQQHIIVCYEVACLDPHWRQWLCNLVCKSKYVDVVPPTETFEAWFMLEEEKLCGRQ